MRFAIFSILSLPFTKYFTCQPKAAACFVSCPELKGRWAQEKKLEACRGMRGRRQKGKTTDWLKEKLKTDAMPEMLKWNHSSVFPLTFQSPQSVNRYKLFGYWKYSQLRKVHDTTELRIVASTASMLEEPSIKMWGTKSLSLLCCVTK